jgi:hypothetical protein
MIEMKSRLGLMTGLMAVACLAACAPTPVTRTVTSEQVTTTTPPPPPPMITTTTTEGVAQPDDSASRIVTAHRRSARNGDVDEETTETVSPTYVPAPPTITQTTTHTQQFQQQ